MTATIDSVDTDRGTTRPRPHLADAASIVTFGHLMWLAWTWLAATLIYAVVIACVARWGSVDQSLWQSVAAGWQRWVVFAAGVTTTTTFLRMLLRNGATRSLVSSASTVSMAVIGVLAGLWITAGYAVEKVVYERYGWTQGLNSDAVFEWSDTWRVALESPLVLFAYFVSGWLVGAAFYRYGVAGGLILLVPSLAPAALFELFTSKDFGGVDIDALPSAFDRPNLALTACVGAIVVAGSVWIARRVTRKIPLR